MPRLYAYAGPLQVQFEYGNLYRHRYGVGDRIIWGKNKSAIRANGRGFYVVSTTRRDPIATATIRN
jgi:hypothetical protein